MAAFPDVPKALRWGEFGRLTSLDEALASLAPLCDPVAPKALALADAVGRIAAAPLHAPAALPPLALALRDGWAIAAADSVGASGAAPSFASAPLVRVAVGDPVPPGFDAVLPEKSVGGKPPALEILESVAPGEGLRFKGGDFAAGDAIVWTGEALRADRFALAQAAGLVSALARVPRIACLANAAAADFVAHAVDGEGAECAAAGVGKPDFVIAAGQAGASALAAQGAVAFSHAVAMRPGQILCGAVALPGVARPVPFILAPDRLECLLAAFLLIARPCLRRLAGRAAAPLGESLPLARKLVSSPGWTELALLRRGKVDGVAGWEPLACADIPWSAVARAESFLLIEANCEGFPCGQSIFAEFLL